MPRPKKVGLRTRSGQLTRSRAGQRALVDAVVEAQPHRAPFYKLIGASAAMDLRCESALGRLRMVGEAEDTRGAIYVARVLYPGMKRPAEPFSFGISERQYQAGVKYAETVGRERWVRAAPKDKPSAVAFMVARGIDTSARVLGDREAATYVRAFDDARAALLAAGVPADARRVLGHMRALSRSLGSDDMLRMLRGFGSLMNPALAAAIAAAVNHCVIDDRDPPADELPRLRRGLDVLAEHFFGARDPDKRPIRGEGERPEWAHEVSEVTVLYADIEQRIDPKSGRVLSETRGMDRKAQEAPRRRLHPFHGDRG